MHRPWTSSSPGASASARRCAGSSACRAARRWPTRTSSSTPRPGRPGIRWGQRLVAEAARRRLAGDLGQRRGRGEVGARAHRCGGRMDPGPRDGPLGHRAGPGLWLRRLARDAARTVPHARCALRRAFPDRSAARGTRLRPLRLPHRPGCGRRPRRRAHQPPQGRRRAHGALARARRAARSCRGSGGRSAGPHRSQPRRRHPPEVDRTGPGGGRDPHDARRRRRGRPRVRDWTGLAVSNPAGAPSGRLRPGTVRPPPCGPGRRLPPRRDGGSSGAYSGPSRSPIPVQPDHRFRRKPITDSDRTRSPIPVPSRSLFGADRNRAIRPM